MVGRGGRVGRGSMALSVQEVSCTHRKALLYSSCPLEPPATRMGNGNSEPDIAWPDGKGTKRASLFSQPVSIAWRMPRGTWIARFQSNPIAPVCCFPASEKVWSPWRRGWLRATFGRPISRCTIWWQRHPGATKTFSRWFVLTLCRRCKNRDRSRLGSSMTPAW